MAEMDTISILKNVFDLEIESLEQVRNQINTDFEEIVKLIANNKKKMIITGMGKSGHIGKKIAATLSSTGTISIFMHPGEAFHGDLGIIDSGDVVLAISYSGETDEVLKLIPSFKKANVKLISITGNINSTLAKNSMYTINGKIFKEACPLELAPTSSTTAALVIGDAIAVAVMQMKNFKSKDFALFHPGGSLGRKLLCSVKDEMKNDSLPVINENTPIDEVIISITEGRLGLTVVLDEKKIKGIITDGDLRRGLQKYSKDIFNYTAKDIMTNNPTCIEENVNINDAENLMMSKKINSLLVTKDGVFSGILNQRTIKYN